MRWRSGAIVRAARAMLMAEKLRWGGSCCDCSRAPIGKHRFIRNDVGCLPRSRGTSRLRAVQGRFGLIPQEAADEIVSHCRLDQIDLAYCASKLSASANNRLPALRTTLSCLMPHASCLMPHAHAHVALHGHVASQFIVHSTRAWLIGRLGTER